MKRKTAVLTSIALLTGLAPAGSGVVVLKEDYQVLQRDANDSASCAVLLSPQHIQARYLVKIQDDRGRTLRHGEAKSTDVSSNGKGIVVEGLPVGGPYTITVSTQEDPTKIHQVFRNILVGDVWILGGQSNMFGIDVIKEELPALPYLNMLNLLHFQKDAHWCAGAPPIHRIPEPFAQHTLKVQHPEYSDAKIREILDNKTRVGGIDCSYFFARKLFAESGVPIGLIPCATGAALASWNPDERDRNRYGFLAHHVESAGGRVKGMLFFQGEQDAIFGDEAQTITRPTLIAPITTYGDQFIRFVEALRREFGGPDMPVVYAQICRHHNSQVDRSRGWEIIREAQRTIPERLANSHCVPSIHLGLMDGLHLDYESLKTVGVQMADLALPYVKKGTAPRTEVRLKSAAYRGGPRPRIIVEFTGVEGRLKSDGKPTGFVVKERTTGKQLDWIYKTEFDPSRPSTVIVHATSIPNPDVVLYYGAGVAPYVNIVDDRGMSLPVWSGGVEGVRTIAKTAGEEFMLRIAIILGSTRPGRNGEAVAKWVYQIAQKRSDAEFEFVDVKDFNLPLLDEPAPPSLGQYTKEHTKTWAAKIDSFDAYVFVTPEYNHGISAALKNAIDFLFKEWNNKAAGFVGYGSVGGVRAVEHLRLVMAEVQVATVRNQVALSLFTDFENYAHFKPAAHHEKSVNQMLDQLIAWGGAMQSLRVAAQ